ASFVLPSAQFNALCIVLVADALQVGCGFLHQFLAALRRFRVAELGVALGLHSAKLLHKVLPLVLGLHPGTHKLGAHASQPHHIRQQLGAVLAGDGVFQDLLPVVRDSDR
ncbi:MAG: hypothetical protein ACK55I_28050, partial [bacterium]